MSWVFHLHGQAKQKQKGARRMTLPGVEGHEGGKWILIKLRSVFLSVMLDTYIVTEKEKKEEVRYVGILQSMQPKVELVRVSFLAA